MASERTSSRDRNGTVTRSGGSVDIGGKFAIPMWDSSDPNRAPAPLPLRPDQPNKSPTKPNTSANVAAAAQALVERAREGLRSPYTTNNLPERSPERSPTKTPQHKRLQSLQHGVSRSLESLSDKGSSRPTTPSTPITTSGGDVFSSSPPVDRSVTPTLSIKDAVRQPPRSILGENTPPRSSTMLALDAFPTRATSSTTLGDMTNGATPKASSNLAHITEQMNNLTSIANHLQKEMAALSRRSKDNAIDLNNLKEVAGTRDEDIRKSLGEMLHVMRSHEAHLQPLSPRFDSSRPGSSIGFSPSSKPTNVPRLPIFNQEEHERSASPHTSATESAATMAMLEKVIREMATKEGQDQLAQSLTELLSKTPVDERKPQESSKKLQEIVDLIKQQQVDNHTNANRALVRHNDFRRASTNSEDAPSLDIDFDRGVVKTTNSHQSRDIAANTTPAIGEDLHKLLQKIKDSVAQGGGMTGEIKSLVRELRGEVLGMGRELGQKIDHLPSRGSSNMEDAVGISREDIESIVQDGLAELKQTMSHTITSNRRESARSFASGNVNNDEVYSAVRQALIEHGHDNPGTLQPYQESSSFDKESILAAVKEAYEAYKPEIEFQQFGLERDEILQCLREGLEDYQTTRGSQVNGFSNREDIMDAVREAMQDFHPPQPPSEAAMIKEEVLNTVQECLDAFQPSLRNREAISPSDITRDDILDAVRQGLGDFKREGAREIEISPEDLFQAVKAGLETTQVPYGEKVLTSLHDIIDGMRGEFKQYSEANGRDTEQVLDAMKDGLESLRGEIETYVDRAQDVTGKDEIIDALRSAVGDLRGSFERLAANNVRPGSAASAGRSELLDYIKIEFEQLHEAIESQNEPRDHTRGHATHPENVIRAITEGFAALKDHGTSRGLDDIDDERLDALKAEFEQLRESVLSGSAGHKDDILDALQDGLAGVHARSRSLDVLGSSQSHISNPDELISSFRDTIDTIRVQISSDQNEANNEALGLIKEELESFREAIGGSLMLSTTGDSNSDIFQAIEGLKADIDDKLNGALVPSSGHSDTLEAINERLDHIRTEVTRSIDRPTDMTVNYEILDALKDGVSNIRNDIDMLRAKNEVVLAGSLPTEQRPETASSADLEKLEVMLAQIQIKIEAMDHNVQNLPESSNSPTKDDLQGVENIIREIQVTVTDLAARDVTSSKPSDDVEALEILMQNTKAKIDDNIIPVLEARASREQVESIETIARMTSETLDSLLERLDSQSSSKEQISSLQDYMRQSKESLEEIKDKMSQDGDRISRTDFDIIGILCTEIKTKISDFTEASSLPSKTDIEQLHDLVSDLHRSHEADIRVTARAFDDRKDESQEIMSSILDLKTMVEESKEELKARLKRGNADVRALDEILESIEEKVEASPQTIIDLAELKTLLSSEFEKTHASIDEVKTEQGDQASTILERHEQHGATLLQAISERLDKMFSDISAKQEEHRSAVEDTARSLRERATQQDDMLTGSRTMAEDLKVTIDTLGAAVTGITPALEETTEKMAADAKTVFNRVEELHSKLEESTTDGKTDHQLTRGEISKSLAAVNGLQQELTEYNPQFLMLLKSVLAISEQHFEHAKCQGSLNPEDIKAHFDEGFKRIPLPRLEAPPSPRAVEQYDDTHLHSKLDQLLEHLRGPSQQNKIEDIYDQVMKNAADITALVNSQNEKFQIEQESRERDADQAAMDLNKCLNEKERVEGQVGELEKIKYSLTSEVDALKAEKDALAAQKFRLNADVSALEAALNIRREELHAMDARADALERRIIDGVLDHSRALLIAKTPRQPPNMSLKRVASNKSNVSTATATPSMLNASLDMAVKARTPTRRKNESQNNAATRRILSLSQITGNSVNRSKTVTTSSKPAKSGLGNLKRSQSVKQPKLRESSWSGPSADTLHNTAEEKENDAEALSEESEIDEPHRSISFHSSANDNAISPSTDRRMSQGTGNGSEYASYFTGSDVDRRSSYGSTIRSTMAALSSIDDSVHEDDRDDSRSEDGSVIHTNDMPQPLEVVIPGKDNSDNHMTLYDAEDQGFDSGLGSELPTAVEGTLIGSDYFRKEETIAE